MNNRRVITGTVWNGVAAAPPRRAGSTSSSTNSGHSHQPADGGFKSDRPTHPARPIISVEASPQPARSRPAPHGEPPVFSAPGVTLVGRLLLAHGAAIDIARVTRVSAEQVRTAPFGILAVLCGGLAISGVGYILGGDRTMQALTPASTWLGIWLFTVASLVSALRAFTASHLCLVVVSTSDGHSHRIALRGREQARYLAQLVQRAMTLPSRRRN